MSLSKHHFSDEEPFKRSTSFSDLLERFQLQVQFLTGIINTIFVNVEIWLVVKIERVEYFG